MKTERVDSSHTRLVRVGKADELADGQSKEVEADGRMLALFKINGSFYAISNLCLHRGGPLSLGEVEDYKVTCPWHGWKYDVRTGAFEIIPTLRVKSYRVEQKGDDLYIELDHDGKRLDF